MKQGKPDPEIIGAMLEKAREKLASARVCLDAGYFDDAASRAYYAAFHAVSAALGAKGLAYSSHGQTLGAFNREFVQTGLLDPVAFRRLQTLFTSRQTGDYDASSSISRSQAEQSVSDAQWLIAECQRLIGAQ